MEKISCESTSGVLFTGTAEVDRVYGYERIELVGSDGTRVFYECSWPEEYFIVKINEIVFNDLDDFFDACPGSFMEECAEMIVKILTPFY